MKGARKCVRMWAYGVLSDDCDSESPGWPVPWGAKPRLRRRLWRNSGWHATPQVVLPMAIVNCRAFFARWFCFFKLAFALAETASALSCPLLDNAESQAVVSGMGGLQANSAAPGVKYSRACCSKMGLVIDNA